MLITDRDLLHLSVRTLEFGDRKKSLTSVEQGHVQLPRRLVRTELGVGHLRPGPLLSLSFQLAVAY